MKMAKRAGAVCLVLLCCLAAPLLVWVAMIIAFRSIFAERRATRAQLLAGNLACSTNIDCPSGYECVGGMCLPKHA